MKTQSQKSVEEKIELLMNKIGHLSASDRQTYIDELKEKAEAHFKSVGGQDGDGKLLLLNNLLAKYETLQSTPPFDLDAFVVSDNAAPEPKRKSVTSFVVAFGLMGAVGVAIYLWNNSASTPFGVVEVNTAKANSFERKFAEIKDFIASEGNTVESLSNQEGLKITSTRLNASSAGRTQGVFARLDEGFDLSARGKTIKVIAIAKQSIEMPSSSMRIAYSTAATGNSGWKSFDLTNEFAEYEFEYAVVANDRPANGDYVGVWADHEGQGRAVDIKSIEVAIVQPE